MKTVAAAFMMCLLPFFLLAQEYSYLDRTGDEQTQISIQKEQLADGTHTLELKEPDRYSLHYFRPKGFTRKWVHKNRSLNHDFVAERQGNTIRISGTFKGEPVNKAVEIDEAVWINKIDHGLSEWSKSGEDEMVFWVLKLSSDLEPIRFRAERVGLEELSLASGPHKAVKIRLKLDGFLYSHLWSAYCWYRESDGLFLKFEGKNGGPGTPLTVISLQPS
ncbi:MAG: hypothetical protein ACLFT3_01080 [Cyclobacteriaceae bacterium]